MWCIRSKICNNRTGMQTRFRTLYSTLLAGRLDLCEKRPDLCAIASAKALIFRTSRPKIRTSRGYKHLSRVESSTFSEISERICSETAENIGNDLCTFNAQVVSSPDKRRKREFSSRCGTPDHAPRETQNEAGRARCDHAQIAPYVHHSELRKFPKQNALHCASPAIARAATSSLFSSA